MSEYFVDHRRVFDSGDDADISTAFAEGRDVDIEYAFQSLCPVQGCPALCGRLIKESPGKSSSSATRIDEMEAT